MRVGTGCATIRDPVRILTVTNWYPPHHFGGYELSCRDVMTRLVERGDEVRVLCSDERLHGVEDPADDHEKIVRRELRLYLRDGELRHPGVRESLAIERHNHRALEAVLDELSPDIVSAWHFGALSFGLLTAVAARGIPIVYAVCDDWLVYGPELDRWAARFSQAPWRHVAGRVVRPLVGLPTSLPDLGRSGSFCFVSDLTRDRARRLSRWTFPRDTVVYSGIDRTVFPPLPRPPERPWRWKLLYTGRFDPRKGVETLLRALPLLPCDATVDFFGRGGDDERGRLTRLARELGVADRVRFAQLDRSDLPAAYASADCFVFPSEWDEPFGLTPVEAMACGTPVVATGVGGSVEFLRDGENAVLFPAGDSAALASAVRRLSTDVALRRRLVDGGLRTAADLDVDHLADCFAAWHAATARGAVAVPPHRPRPGRLEPRRFVPSTGDVQPELASAVHRRVAGRPGLLLDLRPGDGPPLGAATTVAVRPALTSGIDVVAHPEALPFRDGAFAAVAVTNALEYVADAARALAEARRIGAHRAPLVVAAGNPAAAGRRWRAWRNRVAGVHRPFGTPVGQRPPVAMLPATSLRAAVELVADVDAVEMIGWRGRRRDRLACAITVPQPLRGLRPGIVVEARFR